MFSKFKYHILLHLIIVMWGFTGILGKLIALEAFVIVWYRVFIAFIGIALLMIVLRVSFKVANSKSLLQIIIVGVIVGLHWVTFYKSIQLSTASLGILCLSTTTIHVSWLEPMVMKRRFSWIEFALGLIVIYGIYFVSGDFSPNEYLALIYGLCSALLAAIFAVYNAKLAQTTSPLKISFYEMVAAFVAISFFLIYQGRLNASIFVMSVEDLLWLLFLGLFCTSFAFFATIEVMKRLGAFVVALSINLEPVYTILLAIFILKENELLGLNFYIGSLIIVAVVIANPLIKSFLFKRKSF